MTPDERAAIEARDAAIGTGNHARKQFGPTAVRAILDRRHLLVALRDAEAERDAAQAREARLREALDDAAKTAHWLADPGTLWATCDRVECQGWRAVLAVTEPEAE